VTERAKPCASVPWSTAQWSDDTSAWIGERLRAVHGGDVRTIARHRVSRASFVAKVETARGTFFFKAVLPTERPEAPLLALLGATCPDHVPEVVAFDPARCWMLTRAVVGRHLFLVSDLACWTTALERFGVMQRDFVSRVDALTAIGCPVVTPSQVVDDLDALLGQEMSWLPLTDGDRRRLQLAGLQWRQVAREHRIGGVPEATLDHADLHPNNILVTDAGCVFLDWEDGAVSHPFLAPHVFLGYVAQLLPDMRGALPTLRDAYLRVWADAADWSTLVGGFERVRPLAYVKFAAGIARWYARIGDGRTPATDRAVGETVTRGLRTALLTVPADASVARAF
jgi:hypothetical protein